MAVRTVQLAFLVDQLMPAPQTETPMLAVFLDITEPSSDIPESLIAVNFSAFNSQPDNFNHRSQ